MGHYYPEDSESAVFLPNETNYFLIIKPLEQKLEGLFLQLTQRII